MLFLLLQECVPVILSDQVELPFQNVVDYTQISIKWPSTRIGPELLQYLESIPGQMQHSIYILLWSIYISAYHCKNFCPISYVLILCFFLSCRWKYRGDDKPWQTSKMFMGLCFWISFMFCNACNSLGTSEESQAVSPVNWNILAAQWICCK